MKVVRRWWPAAVALVAVLLVQAFAFTGRYDVGGHAAEHLGSATAPFAAAFLVFLLLFTTPPARRQVAVLAASAAWFGATVLVLVGNVRVVDALIDAGHRHTPTDALVETGTIEDAHDLANLAPWLGVLAALGIVLAVFVYGHISRRVAIWSGVLCVVFPPWIIPGAGVGVVVVARAVAYQRESTATEVTPRSS